MPLKLLELFFIERLPHRLVLRIGKDDVPALLELLGAFDGLELHFAADVFRALAPLELYAVHAELLDGVLCRPETRVLHVLLKDDLAVAVEPLLEALYPPL